MSDQGEKIVSLAREMLKADLPEIETRRGAAKCSMSFKTLCFTAVLAASGGALVAEYAHEQDRPLNRYEKTEIQALLFYAAKTKGLDEKTLQREVAQKIGALDVNDITAAQFATARRYLQDKAQ